jgi:hypothetical protein
MICTSFHPSDPLAAACRLANYWKQRKEIFTNERAFLPIDLTGNGALTPDDINHLRTGFCVNLPQDAQGRSVLYVDISKHRPEMAPSLRTIFFFLQCVMENENSRRHGFYTVFNISNPFAANYSTSAAQCNRKLMDHCMAIPLQRLVFVHMPPPGAAITQSFIDTSKRVFFFLCLFVCFSFPFFCSVVHEKKLILQGVMHFLISFF